MNVCEHGSLKRSCQRCDDTAEIAGLRAQLDRERRRRRYYQKTMLISVFRRKEQWSHNGTLPRWELRKHRVMRIEP